MKVILYNNKEKDYGGHCINALIEQLNLNGIEYEILNDEDLNKSASADALYAIGGDGTILYLAEYANKNNIPIIGINAGKLGFLCEFERNEIQDSVQLLLSGKYIKDRRLMLEVSHDNKKYYALNDLYIQRTYDCSLGNMVAEIRIDIEGVSVAQFKGDGAIISTPTGSTAYSFSLGAPILAPNVSAFIMTPIAAHSFNQRPVVYAANSSCKINVSGKASVGVFVDGRYVERLHDNESLEISCMKSVVTFLRKVDYNFFSRLSKKLYKNTDGEDNG